MHEDCGRLIQEVNSAVALGDVGRVTGRVKDVLQGLSRDPDFRLPPRLTGERSDCYARRLLHRDPAAGFSMVVMTWGPGQHTQLHDHAGMWCVECVMQGEITVDRYDLLERCDPRYRFEHRGTVRAGVGEAGCLIPPFEYHVLSNALPDRKSVSLHVYGGEMDHCNLFLPSSGGWWHRQPKPLEYDDSHP